MRATNMFRFSMWTTERVLVPRTAQWLPVAPMQGQMVSVHVVTETDDERVGHVLRCATGYVALAPNEQVVAQFETESDLTGYVIVREEPT